MYFHVEYVDFNFLHQFSEQDHHWNEAGCKDAVCRIKLVSLKQILVALRIDNFKEELWLFIDSSQ